MATYRIRPCARLSGEITVHSAKNAVLPLMCGALLTRETVTIEQIPALTDVKTLRQSRTKKEQPKGRKRGIIKR